LDIRSLLRECSSLKTGKLVEGIALVSLSKQSKTAFVYGYEWEEDQNKLTVDWSKY